MMLLIHIEFKDRSECGSSDRKNVIVRGLGHTYSRSVQHPQPHNVAEAGADWTNDSLGGTHGSAPKK